MPERTFPLVFGLRKISYLQTLLIVSIFLLKVHSIFGEETRPNIILIMCDDMGFSDLGSYGGEIETPNLDSLAYNGLRFTDFHNNAKCSETRASLMTGLWHQQSKNLKKPNHVTLAEVLKSSGYSTSMVGKWHVNGHPMDRGFEHYFGFLNGCINFFNGNEWNSGENNMYLGKKPWIAGDDFYSTDAFTHFAKEFITEMTINKPDSPFFLYLAHNAPHFPLQAPGVNIEKYKGKYRLGWDNLRKNRAERMKKLGIIDQNWKLSDRDPKIESWSSLDNEEKRFMEPMMEVYAAMLDRLDENIGELIQYLKKRNLFENTLIMFLSDNGACPYERLRNDILTPGPEESEIAYDARWANACNTPLRLYKQYAHNGGTLTPFIAHWPKKIKNKGSITTRIGHIVDIMPTLIDVGMAEYPTKLNGKNILPMEGESLINILLGTSDSQTRTKPIFWEFSGHHAIRIGPWKLVAEKSKEWELYKIDKDRTESNNLAKKYPEKVEELAVLYKHWAERANALSHESALKRKPSSQSQLFDFEKILK